MALVDVAEAVDKGPRAHHGPQEVRAAGVQHRAVALGDLVEAAPRRAVGDHDVDRGRAGAVIGARRWTGRRRRRGGGGGGGGGGGERPHRGPGDVPGVGERGARRAEAVLVPPVGEAPVHELGRVRAGVDGGAGAVRQLDGVLALVEEGDALPPGAAVRRRPEIPRGGPLGTGPPTPRGDPPVPPVRADEVAVQRQVVVAGDDELDGRVDVPQHVQRRVVLRDAAGHGQVPAVYQQVRRRQRRPEGGRRRRAAPCAAVAGGGGVGVGVGVRQGRAVRVGDDQYARLDGVFRHGSVRSRVPTTALSPPKTGFVDVHMGDECGETKMKSSCPTKNTELTTVYPAGPV